MVDSSIDITRIRVTTNGQIIRTPWRNQITPAPTVTTQPSISGTVAPGQTVTAVVGVYSGTSVTHDRWEWTQYNAAGAVVGTGNDPTYAISSTAPTGKLVLIEHVLDAYQRSPIPAPKAEATITAVAGLPVFTTQPTISGSATVGNQLTATYGAATGSPTPTLTGQWYRGSSAISGATALTYTTVSGDVGNALKYVVTATSGSNTATAETSTITIVAAPATVLSRRFPVATQAEWDAVVSRGYVPGDAMQKFHHASNCRGTPLRGYGAVDVGGVWATYDGGRSWRAPRAKGLYSLQLHGVIVDPVNPDRVFVNAGGNYAYDADHGGIYFSSDGGATFAYTGIANVSKAERMTGAAIAWDPSSVGGARAEKWFGIPMARTVADADKTDIRMGYSTNGGSTWTQCTTRWNENTYGQAEFMTGDPRVAGRFWVSTTLGLVRIDNAFSATPTFNTANANVGDGKAGGPVVFNSDGSKFRVGIKGQGIWERTNDSSGNGSWTKINTLSNFERLWISPYDFNWMISHRSESDSPFRPSYCVDHSASTTFVAVADGDVEKRPGVTHASEMSDQYTSLFFQPTSGSTRKVTICGMQKNVGYGNNWYTSEDGGKTWKLGNEGYCGVNTNAPAGLVSAWDPVSKDRFIFSVADRGVCVTLAGGKYFKPNTLSYANDALGSDITHGTCGGAAAHPTASRMFAVIMTTSGSNVGGLCISEDDGTTWSRMKISGTAPAARAAPGVFRNHSNASFWFWGRYRSTDGGVTWAEMSGLDAADNVFGVSQKTSGTNAIWSINCGASSTSDIKVIKRSVDNGATWTTVITLARPNRGTGRFGLFAAHPTDNTKVYTGDTESGAAYASWCYLEWTVPSSGSATFKRLNVFGVTTKPSDIGDEFTLKLLAIDPRTPDVQYAGTGGSPGSPNLFRTENASATTPTFTALTDLVAQAGLVNGMGVSPVTGDLLVGGTKGMHVVAPPYAQTGRLMDYLPYEAYLGAPSSSTSAPVFTTQPTISRNATSGVFTATNGSVSGSPTPSVTGRWMTSSTSTGTLSAVSGATALTWTPTASNAGQYVAYEATATNGVGSAAVATTSRVQIPTGNTQEGFTAQPTVSGTFQPGNTISTTDGTYAGAPTKIEYQWVVDGTLSTTLTASSFKLSSQSPGKKIKGRVVLTYASGGVYQSNYSTETEVLAALTTFPALDNVSKSASNASKKWNVMDYPYVQYQDARATLSSGNWNQHGLALAAYAGWQSGDTDICDWVTGGLKDILIKGNDVRLAMGYGAMYPMTQVTAIYFANKTDKIKSEFTTTQWSYLDAVIKLAGIAAAAVGRDTNETQKDMAGDDNASTITGGSNPNIRMPHYSIPQMLCAYLGSSAKGKEFFEGVTESSIKALRDLVAPTMPRTASAFANTRPSGAPTFAKMVSKCNSYVTGGLKIDDHVDIYVREMNFCYDKAAFLGLNNGAGSTQSDGGKNIGRGRFDDVDTVKNLQAYKDIAGQIGMCHELNTSDGAGDRSSMGYAGFADGPSTCYSLGILTSGLVAPSNTKIKALNARFKVNQAFNQLADAQTYLSCAQSGPSSTSRYANSEPWSLSGQGVRWMVPPRRAAMQAIIDIIDAA